MFRLSYRICAPGLAWRAISTDNTLRKTVARTTAQTGNLTVILIGGGLFVILAIALTTELFAKNSPSVLYSQAVDMIRSSDAVRFSFTSSSINTCRLFPFIVQANENLTFHVI